MICSLLTEEDKEIETCHFRRKLEDVELVCNYVDCKCIISTWCYDTVSDKQLDPVLTYLTDEGNLIFA
jgi:hypothetical protein